MKKFLLLICLFLLMGNPAALIAAEDKYGTDSIRKPDPDAFINLGKTIFTYPDPGPSGSEAADKEQEKKKEALEKKVDDAIKRAWEEK